MNVIHVESVAEIGEAGKVHARVGAICVSFSDCIDELYLINRCYDTDSHKTFVWSFVNALPQATRSFVFS